MLVSNNFTAKYVFVTNLNKRRYRLISISSISGRSDAEAIADCRARRRTHGPWLSSVRTKYYQHCSPSSNDAFPLHVVPMNRAYMTVCVVLLMSSILGILWAVLWVVEPVRDATL